MVNAPVWLEMSSLPIKNEDICIYKQMFSP